MNKPLRIAVADDEGDILDYFRKILPRLGHQVVAAARDGCELVEQCRAKCPDLVITDIRMPEMDGMEAITRICQQGPVPVILMTACHDPERLRRAEVRHVVGYLIKPIRQADLGPTITRDLERFERSQALS